MFKNEAPFDGDSEVFENQGYLEIQDELARHEQWNRIRR